jgi:spore coat polysaccharide biosynthesis predicted glycosyltransferase SpsG
MGCCIVNNNPYTSVAMKKVLFRADANQSIGIGDLMSLIHLSRYFEADDWESFFLIKDYSAGLRLIAEYSVNNLKVIDKEFATPDEVEVINGYINDKGIDLLFLVITEKKLSEYAGLSSGAKKACVSFDGAIVPDLDLVVDWDVAAADFFEPESFPNTNFLLGPEYVILPIEFDSDRIRNRKYNSTPEKLLICMGGSDELNLTQKIVNTLIHHKVSLKTTIVVGAGYEYREQLEQSIQGKAGLFVIKQNVSTMFAEYMSCDVAIGTGGLTSSELVATRTPAALVAACEHQIARCRFFHEQMWCRYLGYRTFNSAELLDFISNPIYQTEVNIFHTRKIMESVNELF